MKRILVIAVILFNTLLFAMGEPIQIPNVWNLSVNTGDVYHEKYEVVPFMIEGMNLEGYKDIVSLPNKKVLIYKYFNDKQNKQYFETALIYDFKDKSVKYLYREKKVPDSAYRDLQLKNGKVLIKRGYNYSVDLSLPDTSFFELFNPETEEVEYRITRDTSIDVLGEIEPNKVIFTYLGQYFILDVKDKIFTEHIPKFNGGEDLRSGNRILPLFYDGELYLYCRDKNFPYDVIYKKNKDTSKYEKVATENVYKYNLLISKDKLVGIGSEYGWVFSISQNKLLTNNDFNKKGKMHFKRDDILDGDLVLLDDGNVLITSGYGGLEPRGLGYVNVYNDSLELYVVSEDRFVLFKTPQKNGARKSAKLSNGDVLIYDSTDADLFRKRKPPQSH